MPVPVDKKDAKKLVVTPVKQEVKAADPEVKSILSKITLANPYTKVTAYAGVVKDHIIVDSWWESQVNAKLASWK